MNEYLINQLTEQKILPIIRRKNPQEVIETVTALKEGGIKIVEVNVESPEIYTAIKQLSEEVTICAGGIITSIQANAAFEAGAKLISSPIFQMNLVKLSKDKHIPYIAGTSTANEAYEAWKARLPLIKIYPIKAIGGVSYIEDLLRPMPFLNILPQGSVKLSEVKQYINAGCKAVGIGRDLFNNRTYDEITAKISEFLKEIKD